MEENSANVIGGIGEAVVAGNPEVLPTKISAWTKIKNFLFQDVTQIEYSPKQEQAREELHNFWFQDLNKISFKEFWLQKIELR